MCTFSLDAGRTRSLPEPCASSIGLLGAATGSLTGLLDATMHSLTTGSLTGLLDAAMGSLTTGSLTGLLDGTTGSLTGLLDATTGSLTTGSLDATTGSMIENPDATSGSGLRGHRIWLCPIQTILVLVTTVLHVAVIC